MPNFNDPAILGVMIPIIALCIPIVAILMAPVQLALKQRAQSEARRMYERLTREKLDILRSAVAMGYKSEELADLDARLERLVGPDKLAQILPDKGKTATTKSAPAVPKVPELDLEAEMEQIRQASQITTRS